MTPLERWGGPTPQKPCLGSQTASLQEAGLARFCWLHSRLAVGTVGGGHRASARQNTGPQTERDPAAGTGLAKMSLLWGPKDATLQKKKKKRCNVLQVPAPGTRSGHQEMPAGDQGALIPIASLAEKHWEKFLLQNVPNRGGITCVFP